MTDAIAARLTLARSVAAEAGALALAFFRNRDSLVVESKTSAQDIVSQADVEVEELIRARLSAAFPEDGFQGEEGGAQPGSSGFTWIIDPIDGTMPFLSGLPHWCVVIARRQGEQTVAGIIEHPMAAETFHVRAGQGAFLNDRPLRISPDLTLANCMVALGASARTAPAHVAAVVTGLIAAGGMFYRNGSGAIMLASVAAGRVGGYYEPHMHPWDCLAGILLIREAGGQAEPFPGDGSGARVLVAAPGVWDGLRAVIKAAG